MASCSDEADSPIMPAVSMPPDCIDDIYSHTVPHSAYPRVQDDIRLMDFHFSDHSGTRPGVHGAPAASMSFSNLTRSVSTRVRSFVSTSPKSEAAML